MVVILLLRILVGMVACCFLFFFLVFSTSTSTFHGFYQVLEEPLVGVIIICDRSWSGGNGYPAQTIGPKSKIIYRKCIVIDYVVVVVFEVNDLHRRIPIQGKNTTGIRGWLKWWRGGQGGR